MKNSTKIIFSIGISAIVLVYIPYIFLQQHQAEMIAQIPKVGPSYLYPDFIKTPGVVNQNVTQDNIQQTICVKGWTATPGLRPGSSYTTALKIKQLANGYAYNNDTNPKDYEEDHLISLELGGNPSDPRNLWPEPYNTVFDGQKVGAHQKDATENALKRAVCDGTLSLVEAQRIISTDWYSYFVLNIKNKVGAIQEMSDPDDQ